MSIVKLRILRLTIQSGGHKQDPIQLVENKKNGKSGSKDGACYPPNSINGTCICHPLNWSIFPPWWGIKRSGICRSYEWNLLELCDWPNLVCSHKLTHLWAFRRDGLGFPEREADGYSQSDFQWRMAVIYSGWSKEYLDYLWTSN